MVKSSQFGKIAKQAGQNKRAGGYLFQIYQTTWQKMCEQYDFFVKSMRACFSQIILSVNYDQILDHSNSFQRLLWTVPNATQGKKLSRFAKKKRSLCTKKVNDTTPKVE